MDVHAPPARVRLRSLRIAIAASTLAMAVLAGGLVGVSPAGAIAFGFDDVNTPSANAVVRLLSDGGPCTGTLVTSDVVLTAGHCVSGETRGDPSHPPAQVLPGCPSDWQVRGRWYPVQKPASIQVGNGSAPFLTRAVSHYTLPVCADMMMLRLTSPVPRSWAIPIPVLGHFGDDAGGRDASRFVGETFELVGWGRDENGNPPAIRQKGGGWYASHTDQKLFVDGFGNTVLRSSDSGSPLLWRSPSGIKYVVAVAQGWTGALSRYTVTFRGWLGSLPAVSSWFDIANPYALFCPQVATRPAGTVPVVSWWSGGRGDNHAAGGPTWGGCSSALRSPDYGFVRTEGYAFDPARPQPPGTIPLYRWFSPGRGDNWTTTQHGNIGAVGGDLTPDYRFVRREGYVYHPALSQPPGTIPLYSWFSPGRGDNWTTTQHGNIGAVGGSLSPDYRFVRLEGYVLTG